MYNDKRYSLTRFSVNRENRALDIRESFSEVLGAVAGAAVPVDFRDRFSETAQLNVMGTVSVVSAFSALAELTAAARLSADVVSRAAFGEALHGAAHGKKNTPGGTGNGGNSDGAHMAREKHARRYRACGEADGPDCRFKECPGGFNRLGSSDFHVRSHVPDHGADNGSTFQSSNELTPFGISIFPSHTKTRKTSIANRFTMSGTIAASYTASCRTRWKQTRPGV